MIDRLRMRDQLVLHEGLRLTPYRDSLENWTIGVGYNISGRGWEALEKTTGFALKPARPLEELTPTELDRVRISTVDAYHQLDVDVDRAETAVRTHVAGYDALVEPRQRVLVDLAFNMGTSLFTFHKTLQAVAAGDWSKASMELWRSKWAKQVGDGPGKRVDRADRLTKMMLTGQDYTE